MGVLASGNGPRSSAVALMDSPGGGSARLGSQRYGSQRFGSQRFGGNAFGNLPLVPPPTGGNSLPSPRPPPAARPSQQQPQLPQYQGSGGGGPRSVSNDSALMMEIESLAKSVVAVVPDAGNGATKVVPSPPMQPRPPASPASSTTAAGAAAPSPRITTSPSQATLHQQQPSPDPLADPLLQDLESTYVADPPDPARDPLDPAALDDLLAEFAAPQPPRVGSLKPQPPPAIDAGGPPLLGASPRVLPLQQSQPEVWIDNAAVGGGGVEGAAGGPTSEATEGERGVSAADAASRLMRASALTPSELALMMGTPPEPR